MAAKHAAKFFSLVTHGSLWKWEETVGDPPSSISGSVIELEARVLNEHTQLRLPQGDVLEVWGRIQMILANRHKKG